MNCRAGICADLACQGPSPRRHTVSTMSVTAASQSERREHGPKCTRQPAVETRPYGGSALMAADILSEGSSNMQVVSELELFLVRA